MLVAVELEDVPVVCLFANLPVVARLHIADVCLEDFNLELVLHATFVVRLIVLSIVSFVGVVNL